LEDVFLAWLSWQPIKKNIAVKTNKIQKVLTFFIFVYLSLRLI